MPITCQWDDEDKTTIFQQYVGSWTWEELWAGVDVIMAMMDEVDHPVDIIIDMAAFEVPMDFMSHIKVIDEAVSKLLPKMRYAIAFETPGLMQAILRVAKTLYVRVARHVIVVKTEEDARAFLVKNPHPSTTSHQS